MRLYVSDLDGTLLGSNDKLSNETVGILKKCMAEGTYFTIATGRSLFYSKKYIDEIGIKLPVILSNGVYIYNPVSSEYLVENFLDREVSDSILNLLDSEDIRPFINVVENDVNEKIYHKNLQSESMKRVYEWQIRNNDDRQVMIDNYKFDSSLKVVSINVIDNESRLRPFYSIIKKEFDVICYFMEDHHYPGCFWLEVYNPNASKGKGIEWLKKYLNPHQVISFGDSHNDISMFEVSDVSCAVSNASDLIKNKASCIIGSNDEDSVAKFILNPKYLKVR